MADAGWGYLSSQTGSGVGGTPTLPPAGGSGSSLSDLLGIGSGDPNNRDRRHLDQNAADAASFAQQARGNYGQDRTALLGTQGYLNDQMMGKNSVSAEQLRQSLMQNQAAQQSMAAGASPNNAAMAARNAAMNMGRQGYGLAGQQAVAGLQERNQAANSLLGSQGQMYGMDTNATLGGYGAATQGYGTSMGNPQKGWGDLLQGAVGGAAAGLTRSDVRSKKDIEDGDSLSAKALSKLKAFKYKYKDERDGKGQQFGVMAQDLEEAGLGHAVVDTPKGKYVDGGKAALSSLGLVAALGRRVSELEGKGGK